MTIKEFFEKYKENVISACVEANLGSGRYAIAMDGNKYVGVCYDISTTEFIKADCDKDSFWNQDCWQEIEVDHKETELVIDWNTNYAEFELKVTAEII